MTTAPRDQAARAVLSRQPGGGHRRRRRAVAAGAVVLVAGAGAAAAVITDPFAAPGSPAAAASGSYHTATAVVTRQPLMSQTPVNATLGYAGSYTVVNQAGGSGPGVTGGSPGTYTWLPAAGKVVREGQVLYEVSGTPVVLLYGHVPAYRSLSEGMTGKDVTELNAALAGLGYATRAELAPLDYFGAETGYALQGLQAHLGLTVTGTLPLGQAVFLPGAARVTALGATTVLGGTATTGAAVLTATSTTPVVTIGLDAAQQTEVRDGDHVTVTLPDGTNTPGVISSVGTVATSPPGSSGSGGSGGRPTITVEVSLADPGAARHLDQAPVTVAITTGSVHNALVVPVDALLARAGGGYAVEVAGPGQTHRLVAVSPGMFDDAAGLVQVTGAGLAAGQRVVVPAT